MRRTEVVALILATAALIACVLALPGCDGTTSFQRAQLPVVTPSEDPRHTLTGRHFTTWCGPTCYSVVTESVESGEVDTWPADMTPPWIPYQDPRTPRVPETICEPVVP